MKKKLVIYISLCLGLFVLTHGHVFFVDDIVSDEVDKDIQEEVWWENNEDQDMRNSDWKNNNESETNGEILNTQEKSNLEEIIKKVEEEEKILQENFNKKSDVEKAWPSPEFMQLWESLDELMWKKDFDKNEFEGDKKDW